jgi:hypothetical protein
MAARVCIGALAGLLLLFALPATAPAACSGSTAPPGNSEVDQYAETVPGTCGESPPGSGGDQTSGGGNSNSIPPSTLNRLQGQGADGQAAAALAEANAPAEAGQGSGGSQQPGGPATHRTPAPESGSPWSEILGTLTGNSDGGMGWLLPLFLVAISLAGGLYLYNRRRGAS